MPQPELFHRHQKAVYWPSAGYDNYGKAYVTDASKVELDVRWEFRKGDILDARGNTIAYDATVVVDRVIANGSILWKGSLDDLPDDTSNYSDLWQVIEYSEIPDLKNRYYRRLVYLKRHSDRLPVSS